MLGVTFVTCFCVLSLNLYGLSDGKPIPGLQFTENPEVTTIKIPRVIISREELIALAQYAMRMMASRINITLQATTSHTDFPQYADHVQVDSGDAQSTTPTPFKYYENLGNTKQMNQKLPQPCRTSEEAENSGSLAQAPDIIDPAKPTVKNSARLTIGERPTLSYEPFVRYAERNIESFPDRFDFELTPNSQMSKTYIPQAGIITGALPLMQQVMNGSSLPSAIPIISAPGEKDLHSSNIRIRNLTIERIPSSQPGNAVMSVPFEAIITFTRQKPSISKLQVEDQNIVVIPTRDPPDDFPPYFETVLSLGKKISESKSGSLNLNREKNLNPARETVNELKADKKDEALKPMTKRQTLKLGELLGISGLSTKNSKRSRKGSEKRTTPSSISIEPFRNMNTQQFSSVTFEESTTSKPQGGPVSQRQEIEEEDEGSLGSITDLLPLLLPVLEEISNPNSDTDIAELLQAGLPLVQGVSQGDGENDGVDVVGIVSPVIASLSGPNRNGNGTVLQTILPLVLPLITPFIGPIIGPIIQGSSSPANQGGSSITPIIQALAGPLSLPTEPGGISIASSLISGIIASLSKDLKAGGNGGSDIGALVSTVVSGVLAGGSAGLSAKFMKPPHARPARVAYGQAPVPASSVDTLDLVGTSLKEILGLTLQLIKSVIASVTGILGASSVEQPQLIYGPTKAKFHVT